MAEVQEALAHRIDELASKLAGLERRLAALEAAAPATATPAYEPEAMPLPSIPRGLVTLLGRTLVVLAGGYLLRAIADAGVVPVTAAAVSGLAYAAGWLWRADREARSPEGRTSATFHGLASLAIALPLALESTLRFGAFDAAVGSLAVLATTAAGIVVGLRRELALVRWASALLGIATALALLVGANDPLPVVFALLALGAVVEAVTVPGHGGLRWPAAAGADLALLACLGVATRPGGPPEGYAPMPLSLVASAALGLPLVYVASAVWRTLARSARPGAFELLQTGAALLVGLGGAASALEAGAISTWPLGATALVLGGGLYLAAFSVIDRRSGQTSTFYGYTTFGGVLTAVGCLWLATSHLLTALFAALGLAAVDLGLRTGRRTLGIHGVLFLLGACASAGLLPAAGRALFAPAGSAMPAPGLAAAGAFAACLAAYVGLVRRAATLPGGGFWPRLVLACCLGWSVAGSTTLALVGGLSWLAGRSLGAGAQATSRTAVLSALAIALSALARRVSARELALLAPTVLVVTGVKLVVEDFQQGHPASIFLTLALYGGALIATSRLGRN